MSQSSTKSGRHLSQKLLRRTRLYTTVGRRTAMGKAQCIATQNVARGSYRDCSRVIRSDTITGLGTVVNGDTIEISDERIRVDGIDPPGSWQRRQDAAGAGCRCGASAAAALDAFLAQSRPSTCTRKMRQEDRQMRPGRRSRRSVMAPRPRLAEGLRGGYAPHQRAAAAAKAGLLAAAFIELW